MFLDWMTQIPKNEFSELHTADQPGADKWYHIILHNQREGETFGECELRLRSYVLTGEKLRYNWQGGPDVQPFSPAQ